jgi:hypothetical protein
MREFGVIPGTTRPIQGSKIKHNKQHREHPRPTNDACPQSTARDRRSTPTPKAIPNHYRTHAGEEDGQHHHRRAQHHQRHHRHTLETSTATQLQTIATKRPTHNNSLTGMMGTGQWSVGDW